MKLEGLLADSKAAILDRWRHLIRQTYPPETARFLEKEKDEFANPVGHFIRQGCEEVFDELVGCMDREVLRRAVDPIVRIRAVQDFDAADSVRFVFFLKKAAGEEIGRGGQAGVLAELEARVDELALVAFDVYARCREQIHEIRIREVKSRSAVIMRRFEVPVPDPDAVHEPGSGKA